jgi:ubiquinone/menaquinone biosynthesis C-methylase UbiE
VGVTLLSQYRVSSAETIAERSATAPAPLTHYKGRRIATTMHYRGAPWLLRDDREEQERCSLLLANLGVQPSMTVCDMGCGNGFYALQLAKMVGPDGRILAVDIQPEMLELLRDRAARKQITNIEPILSEAHDPKLPEGKIDLILLVDVYHEFSHPEQMLAAMRRSLSPTGLIALLEYRAEDPKVPIKPLHKMTKKQILKEFPPNGFKLVKEFDRLPWQHMMFFGRDEK